MITIPEEHPTLIALEDSVEEGFLKINEALQYTTPIGILQRSKVLAQTTVVIPEDMQHMVFGQFIVEGSLTVNGKIVIL
jgi:hypothetical protein